MTAPYAPPPTQPPERVPANLHPQPSRARQVVLLGFFGMCVAATLWVVMSPGGPVPQTPPSVREFHAWPLVLPLLTLLALVESLRRLRSRLPAKYRTGELRIIPRAPPAPQPGGQAPPPAPFEPIEFEGVSAQRGPARLRVDEAGLHWSANAKLLRPAQWLDVRWDELNSFSVGAQGRASRSGAQWVTYIGLFLALYGWQSGAPWALGTGIVLLIIGLASWIRPPRGGTFSFSTETHALSLSSARLDDSLSDRLVSAARARRPDLVPSATPATGRRRSGLWLLFVRPYTEISILFRSDEWILRERESTAGADAPKPDGPESLLAHIIHRRILAVWSSGLFALLPLVTGLSTGLCTESPSVPFVAYILTWFVGVVVSTRLTERLARYTGMSIIK